VKSVGEHFDAWADMYRTWCDLVPGDDLDFYRGLAERSGRPVADLGIGLGRVAMAVNPDIGIDVSSVMLEESRRRLGPSVRLMRASIADYTLDEPAAFSYAAQNTLNLVAPADQPAVFATVLRNTMPGGLFAFETAIARPTRLRLRDRVPVLRASGSGFAVFDVTRLTDSQGHQAELIGIVDQMDDQGMVIQRRYFPPVPFTFLTVQTLTTWAIDAGWRVESVAADVMGGVLTSEPSSAVWCLRRPT
jgi:SAM-dependent methyltransferase